MKILLRIAPLVVAAPLMAVAACASASASKPEPGLLIPPPPPRVVPITPETVLEPVGEIPGGTGTTSNATPANRGGRGTRETPARPAGDVKPESKPPETAPQPEATAPAPVVPPAPAPQLRPVESAANEGSVRVTIDRTRQILSTIDYRKLSAERRKAYDDAKKFADQADDALKQGNVVFAQGVAGKAETLAKELATR